MPVAMIKAPRNGRGAKGSREINVPIEDIPVATPDMLTGLGVHRVEMVPVTELGTDKRFND